MKKLFLITMILAAGTIFTACQKDEMNMENVELKRGNAAVQNHSSLVFDSKGCVDVPHVFTLSYSANGNGATVLQAQYKVDGEWIQFFHDNKPVDNPAVFEFTFTEPGNYPIRFSAGPGGFTVVGTVEVENCSTCENTLTADLDCGDVNTLTITFKAEEAGPIVIQGGLTAGTMITNSVSSDLVLTDHQSSGGPSNVTRWEGDVEACQEVTITITFTGGNGVGDWSAKRGEELLGETDAISCK